jgi:glycerol kinase
MSQYILAIDEGTTGVKALLMDLGLNVIGEKTVPFEQHFPQPGWVEHDLHQIWSAVGESVKAVVKLIDPKKIVAIGITNQRETICFWDKKTIEPLRNAIVWQDRRTSNRCQELKNRNFENVVQEKTGLLLDPYFSSTKIEWAIQNDPSVKKAVAEDSLSIGTIDSFLLAKLTGGKVHATEASNASRTMLFHLKDQLWDAEMMKTFGVLDKMLPRVQPSFSKFGKTLGLDFLPDGIPITGIIGDQQSALLGQACIKEGQAKCTYGTGAFLLMNTGSKLKRSKHRLLSTIAWTNESGQTTYALEGSAFMAGATVQWLRDGLKMISSAAEIETLAAEVSSSEGVMMVPAFTGLGAPDWNPNARAVISGLTRGSTRAHIARAALEGIAFQNVDLLKAMEKDLGGKLTSLNVDGGACKNNMLMQIQADLLGCKLLRPVITETTSLGAIFAAGIGAGIWKSEQEVTGVWKLEREFEPKTDDAERTTRLKNWESAKSKAKSEIEVH